MHLGQNSQQKDSGQTIAIHLSRMQQQQPQQLERM